MAKLPTNKRKYQLKEMWDRHHEINRRLLLGQKSKEIAKELGITEATVSYTKNSKLAQKELNIMKVARDADTIDVARQIREIAPQALEVLENIMNDEETAETLKAKVATDLLDRAGYSPPKKVIGAIAHQHFSKEDISKIKQRALKVGIDTGNVVDVKDV
tara:strand:+ start:350 stop:829 length:480 start_codon:yes stop_codon:yes gene_type:complete